MHQLSNVQGGGGREPPRALKTSLSLRGPGLTLFQKWEGQRSEVMAGVRENGLCECSVLSLTCQSLGHESGLLPKEALFCSLQGESLELLVPCTVAPRPGA